MHLPLSFSFPLAVFLSSLWVTVSLPNVSFLLSSTNKSISSSRRMVDEDVNLDRVKIVRVTCLEGEPAVLREGVVDLFKLYFEELYELGCDLGFQGFQSEWEDLPGKYSFENRGGLFVAAIEDENKNVSKVDQIIGCIAIRPLEESCGEVKRMYIRKDYRRFGIGSMLAKSIISHAWEMGYTEIKLDSLERLVGAVKLYESFGFQRIDPYCECPEDDHVCMNVYK